MFMAKQSFHLKRSRFAIAFHFSIFFLLMWVLSFTLSDTLWIACGVLGIIFYVLFARKNQKRVHSLSHLDGRQWTVVQDKHQDTVEISHLIDHQFYIVIYFQHFKAKPVLIWWDQVARKDWKELKKLAQFM